MSAPPSPSSRATTAQRSVPLRQVSGVIATSAPKPRAASAIRSSSVATTTRSTPGTARAASQLRRIRLLASPVAPLSSTSGLPG